MFHLVGIVKNCMKLHWCLADCIWKCYFSTVCNVLLSSSIIIYLFAVAFENCKPSKIQSDQPGIDIGRQCCGHNILISTHTLYSIMAALNTATATASLHLFLTDLLYYHCYWPLACHWLPCSILLIELDLDTGIV